MDILLLFSGVITNQMFLALAEGGVIDVRAIDSSVGG